MIRTNNKSKTISEINTESIYYYSKYILFKELIDNSYEKNIGLLNGKDIDIDFLLKTLLIINNIIKESEYSDDSCYGFNGKSIYFSEKFHSYYDELFPEEDYDKDVEKNINFPIKKYLSNFHSAKELKERFYILKYFKKIQNSEFDNYFQKNIITFDNFIDLLNLEDKELIKYLKSDKLKENTKSNLSEDKIMEKSAKEFYKNIKNYIKVYKKRRKNKIKKNIYFIFILIIILVMVTSLSIYINKRDEQKNY